MTVRYALRSLIHESGRLSIGAASVASALILMLLLFGFRSGLYDSVSAYAIHAGADLFVGQEGATGIVASSSAIRSDLRENVLAISGATAVQPITVSDVIFEHGEYKAPVLLIGYVPGQGLGGPWSIVNGRAPQSDQQEILLDQWLASRNGIDVGQKVFILGQSLEVVGLTGGTSNWMSPILFLPSNTLERILGTKGVVSYFLVDLVASTDREDVIRSLEQQLAGVHAMEPEILAEHDREVLATVMETPLLVMVGISAVIGTAVIGLTSYTSALGRMREYAVLKAIGASAAQMRRWLFQEAYLRCAIGFSLGAAGSLIAAEAIEFVWPQFTVTIEPSAFVWVGLATTLMASVGTLLPLRRVEQLPPALVFGA